MALAQFVFNFRQVLRDTRAAMVDDERYRWRVWGWREQYQKERNKERRAEFDARARTVEKWGIIE